MGLDLNSDAAIFLALEEFAEQIEVHALSQSARPINAIVDRSPPTPLAEAGHVLTGKLLISVANDAVAGIASIGLDRATTKVKVALLDGGVKELRSLGAIASQDAGMLTIWVL